MTKGVLRRSVVVVATAVAIAGFGQASASASVQYLNDKWGPLCPADCADGGAEGGIAWGNRTAEVSGYVWDYRSLESESTVVFIDAYAGTTAIEGQRYGVQPPAIDIRSLLLFIG